MPDLNTVKPVNKDSIRVVVHNRQGILLEDDVLAISGLNERGVFDILPEHANFISIIKETLTLRKKNEKKEMKIGEGILRVYKNEIHIFLDISGYQS